MCYWPLVFTLSSHQGSQLVRLGVVGVCYGVIAGHHTTQTTEDKT
jgi:hypothetical protein